MQVVKTLQRLGHVCSIRHFAVVAHADMSTIALAARHNTASNGYTAAASSPRSAVADVDIGC